MIRTVLALGAAAAALTLVAQPAAAQSRVQREQDSAMAQIPRCAQSLGTLSIVDGQADTWSQHRLAPPQTLLRVVVQRSGCFNLVDRGAGMNAAQRERELAAGGMLQGRSNMGGGQVRAADYVLVAELAGQDANASGGAVAGLLGGMIGGRAGAVIGGIRTNRLEANTVLSLTDVRTSETLAVTEGYATRTDIGWGAGGGLGFAGVVGGGYEDTEIGRIVTQAFIQAYSDMVHQIGGIGGSASAYAPQQSYQVQQSTTLRTAPDGGGVVRALPEGLVLYPTGRREGIWWEVVDDNDNVGWVQNDRLVPTITNAGTGG